MTSITPQAQNRTLTLLTTCGTSLFTNSIAKNAAFGDKERRFLRDHANTGIGALSAEDEAELSRIVEHVQQKLKDASQAEQQKLSAELNGIYASLKRFSAQRVEHLLVHTDTAIGKAAAEQVASCLPNCQKLSAPGLRTADSDEFKGALSEITQSLEVYSKGWHDDSSRQVVFNLTGGFKSVNGYLQALGMHYANYCVFLFESSDHLMEIPRLPVQLNEQKEVSENLASFRKMALGYSLSAKECEGIAGALLTQIDDEAALSVWGDFAWAQAKPTLYCKELLAPLSTRIQVQPSVQKAFASLEQAQKIAVNESLDALSVHLDLDKAFPQNKKFQALKSKTLKKPSTHELYLWTDGAAWRLWGHFENEVFVADSIGKHL